MATRFNAIAFTLPRGRLLGWLGTRGTIVQDELDAHRFASYGDAVKAAEVLPLPPDAAGMMIWEVVHV